MTALPFKPREQENYSISIQAQHANFICVAFFNQSAPNVDSNTKKQPADWQNNLLFTIWKLHVKIISDLRVAPGEVGRGVGKLEIPW